MKLLFIHGARTVEDTEGRIYTDGCFNMSVWRRYLKFTDDFTVILRKETNKVDTITAKNKYNYLDLNIIKFIAAPDLMSPKSNIINLSIRKQHRDIIENEVKKADKIIIRLPSTAGNVGVKLAKKYKKPYLIEAVGDPLTAYWYYGNIFGKILAPLKTLSLKKDIKNASYVLYVSNEFLQKRYPTKGQQAGCPDVVLNEPNIEILNKRIEKIKCMNKNCISIGLIGSLDVAYRGHETLLRVGKELKKRNIICTIKFLGPGNQEKWIELSKTFGIETQIEYHGILPSGDPVFNWIDNIDILIMPTKQETLGRAVIEAMSRACPVIGSSETAIGEQIGSDCLAKSDDYMKISDIVEKMLVNPNYMEYCAKENFYRSFKYTSEQSSLIRDDFFSKFLEEDNISE